MRDVRLAHAVLCHYDAKQLARKLLDPELVDNSF